MSSGWKSQYMALIGLLARRRKELRISQIDLAKQLKAGRRTFQRWEDGRVEPPAKRLFQWAAALGVTIAPDVAQSSADELTAEAINHIRAHVLGISATKIRKAQTQAIQRHRDDCRILSLRMRHRLGQSRPALADDTADQAALARNDRLFPQEGDR
ncbi:MAG: helix-turn-helix transcriptional regulator [Magnetospirillum sp.]|nr:helix-turn-helix transcriptional regulator [Magnetospirillum sp.]